MCEVEPMDGNGLRDRRPKEKKHKELKYHNEGMQLCPEPRKGEKTCGRTPDGTGESSV